MIHLDQALMLQGKPQEAISVFSDAVALGPGCAEAHSQLGAALARQGDLDAAIAHFSVAIKINPHLGEARKGLENALQARGGNLPEGAAVGE